MKLSVGQSLSKAKSHHKNGEFGQAKDLYQQILEKFPGNKKARLGLAALASPASTSKQPTPAQINGLIALLNRGRLVGLLDQVKPLIALFPDADVLYNIQGAAYAGLQQHQEAVHSFTRAIRIDPKYSEAHNNLGNALISLGRLDEAILSLKRAIKIRPSYAEAYYSLGNAFRDKNDMDEAVARYKMAISIRPDYIKAHNSIFEHYEKQNRMEELESALKIAIKYCGEESGDISFRMAQLANRQKRYSDAIDHLEKTNLGNLQSLKIEPYYELLGKTFDKLGESKKAFAAFESHNLIGKKIVDDGLIDPDRFRASVASLSESWAAETAQDWQPGSSCDKHNDPVFLIGFPRSGTTLLDTILGSHGDISVMEEQPIISEMTKVLGLPPTIKNLNNLSDKAAGELRNVYFDGLINHNNTAKAGKVLVDKLPLNIMYVGIIQRVFPNAKFILALRHPCDCVLSCFMQNFALNDAMANFLDLENAAKLYAEIFELWGLYQEKLNPKVHVIRYENLVQDLENTCKPLIDFLGLEWDENLHNYQKTALDRGKINTPSYGQVVQPLYSQASGRWTHYREQMKPVLPILQPWIEKFEYPS